MPYAIGDRKVCSACRVDFPTSQFDKNRAQKDGLANQCRACLAVSRKRTIAKNPSRWKQYQREWNQRDRYGLSPAAYQALVQEQGGLCRVCRQPPKLPFKYLDTDHDHLTGKVRGLLCRPCNTAVGAGQDDPAILRALADYIEAHRERPEE